MSTEEALQTVSFTESDNYVMTVEIKVLLLMAVNLK